MSENQQNQSDQNQDKLNTGLTVLSFCIPLAGAIIYFMKKKDEPKSAQTACYAALIGMGVSLVLNIALRVMGGV
ncbi:hypothetical protein [Flavobacterium filum]|uniref:hypothetical protein n=1 Tax=Flavobacterium TaxID=237 RepID=UPI0003FBD4F9|nr:hypothetical protein [Flavobacterium filum]